MALNSHLRFGSYPAIFDALTVNHIRNVQPSLNMTRSIIYPGGSVDPAIIAEAFEDPSVRISTGDLGVVLAAVSLLNGLAIETTGEIQYQQRADGSTFQGNGFHLTLNSTRGFLVVERISASQDAPTGAELSLMYWALREGSNAPFVVNASQNLTGSPGAAALYKIGPVVFEGTTLRGVQSVSLDTGIKYETKRDSGEVAADVGSIVQRAPRMEISGTNAELAASVGFGAATATSAGIVIYFRKVDSAADSGEHIAISLGEGSQYALEEIPCDNEKDADVKLVVTGAGTFTVDLAADLPA